MAPKRGPSIDDPAGIASTAIKGRRRVGRGSTAGAGANTALSLLPSDIVCEILSWLPARSLSRCRCVCTSWRAMISDPAFVTVQRSRSEPLLVTTCYRGTASKSSSSTLQIMDTDGDVVRLLDLGALWKFRVSLDALVLLTSRHSDQSPDGRIIDLSTAETIVSFPRPAEAADFTWFGFGRAARSGALKVIRIIFRRASSSHGHWTCEVLTLGGDNGWTKTAAPRAMVWDSCALNDGVLVNGVLHFISKPSKQQAGILCFDLESEEWTPIHGPLSGTCCDKICLAELNGALCIAHYAKPYTVDIWRRLTDINKEAVWVRAYTIVLDNGVVSLVPLRVHDRPGGKLLFYYRPDYESNAVLQVYDPSSGKCTDVEEVPTDIIGRIGLCSSHLDRRLCGDH